MAIILNQSWQRRLLNGRKKRLYNSAPVNSLLVLVLWGIMVDSALYVKLNAWERVSVTLTSLQRRIQALPTSVADLRRSKRQKSQQYYYGTFTR